ncbi:MAG: DUF1800 domain-containing protein [Vicinamibacterales bacterium]
MTPNPSFRFRRPAAIATAAGLLILFTGATSAERGASRATAPADRATVAHVLNRVAFGPRPGDIERVQAMGVEAYIDQQLHPERIDDSALARDLERFPTIGMSSRELTSQYFAPADELRRRQQQQQRQNAAAPPDPAMMTPPAGQPARPEVSPEERQVRQRAQSVTNELMQAKMVRAIESEAQLQEVLVDFWFNHFNVFIGKGQVRQYLTEYEREAIRPYVLGSFRDMLGATAHSPAMLFYLDNFQSQTPTPTLVISEQMRRQLDDPNLRPQQRQQLEQRLRQMQARRQQQNPQRPQRGINENYARELMELHTLGVDGGYTQQDVIEVARILTGWTIDQPRQGGTFVFRPQMHDPGVKTVMGRTFAPGGQEEGERLLDMLATHPATAHHIAFKLAQRFVADEPPAALVDRAAKVFLDTKGDLREVTRAILTSDEFLSEDARRVKVKTPLEFIASAMRATGARVNNAQPLVAAMNNLGMPLYGAQPPTGYSMTADAWVNTGALLARMNLAVQLIGGTAPLRPQQNIRGEQMEPPPTGRGRGLVGRNAVRVDVARLVPDTTEATRDALVAALLAGEASAATRDTLARADTPQQLLALTLGSPEFQRR